MTPWERRATWISSAFILLSLLALTYAAMVSEVRPDTRFLVLFVYLIEIISGICAGILAGTIVGFFKVRLEQRFSKTGQMAVQAAGGFAVFLVVMIMSPREQMSKVADVIFQAQLSECQSAADSIDPSADAEGRCNAVIAAYPNRPEPLFLLGRFLHGTSSLRPENLADARDYLVQALNMYKIDPEDTADTLSATLSEFQLSVFREVVYGAAVSIADAGLRAYGVGKGSRDDALSDLEKADQLLALAHDLGERGAGTDYRKRVIAIKGVSLIYSAYIREQLGPEILKSAEEIFRNAIKLDPDGSYFQHYNIFVVSSHRSYAFDDSSALPTALEAISKFVEALPNELENPKNAIFEGRIENWLTKITDNTRKDPFVITRPIGGVLIAGESMARFFSEHPEVKSRLLASFSDGKLGVI